MGVLLWRVRYSVMDFLASGECGHQNIFAPFPLKENIIENIVSSYKLQAVLFFPLCSDHSALLSSTLYRTYG